MRSQVLGADYVNKSVADPADFAAPLQDLVTGHAWGTVWTRPGLSPELRSLATVSMLIALNRPNELKLHMRGALNNGVTPDELRELVMHGSVYCGFPAAMDSMRILKTLLEELGLHGSPAPESAAASTTALTAAPTTQVQGAQ
jgi:4-carboxymuconolactone decarboxylase